MTGARVAESFVDDATDGPSRLGVYGVAVGIAFGLSGVVMMLATAFSIGDKNSDAAIFTVFGLLCLGFAALQRRRPFEARSMRPVPTLTAGVVGYLVVAAISTVIYLVTGSIGRIDDAI